MKLALRDTVVRYASWETFFMRLFVLWPCWSLIERQVVAVQPTPNGLAHFMNLTFLANPAVQNGVMIAFFVAGFFYVIDRLAIPALAIITGIMIAKGTLINSQGAINHSLQLLTLVMLTQLIVQVVAAVKKWAQSEKQIQAMHWVKIVIAASYVSSAFVKLFASNVFWVARVPYLALQIIKSNLQAYYTDLEPMATGWVAEFPYWVASHPNLARVFFSGGLLLELFAFLLLINRRWALAMGAIILIFHESISFLMNIDFKNHVWIVLIFLINVPWLLYQAWRWGTGRKSLPELS
ncbi:MAG: hypothetical protein ABIT76_12475 [Chthoniobacterales bacterium]